VTWTQIAQYIVLIIAYLTPIIILSYQKYGFPIPELTYGQAIADITAREGEMLKTGLATACTASSCPAGTLKPHIEPFMTWSPLNFFGIIFCMMVGTASLPHILMRYFTTPSVREARQSVAWSLFFIFLLYFSAPAYAAFSKLEVYTNIIGRDLESIRPWMFEWGRIGLITICGKAASSVQAVVDACQAIPGHPGIVRFQDFVINTDVIVLSTPEIAGLPYVISGLVAAGGLAAALSTADGLLLAIANALSHDIYYKMIQPLRTGARSAVVAVLSIVVVGVIALFLTGGSPVPIRWAGGLGIVPERWLAMNAVPWNWLLLAALVVVLAIVAPFWVGSNDTAKRLIVARVLLLFVAIAAAATASTNPSDILAMVGWAFSLAMAGNFPALVMGIWWKRTTTTAAICGIIAGFMLCLFYLVTTRYFPGWGVRYFGMTSNLNPVTGAPVVADLAAAMARPDAMQMFTPGSHPLAGRVGWFNLNNINCGLLGMPLGFLVIWIVSYFTKPPSAEMQAFVDEIRKPRGNTILEEKTI
jgi:Na+(H+)/acetate symporter ActP